MEDKAAPEARLATMRRMALIYSRQAKLNESLELYQKTMDECKANLGDDHWLMERVLDKMSDLHLQSNRHPDSAREYQKTLDLLQRRLNKDNLKSLSILCKFADVHLEQHRYQEALNLYMADLRSY
ncbi:uncharacterized protein A1O5_11853 [Cladophialophora psammophila CBS 110553]|uniref:Kinesin light chain n=1 Tax=Cladophialophora psammophila CBS 110553 TaxID=1182543 RepID=W9W9T4_9EURO|nr:uncharacterized protein A1O5_11853 [Cladophialophora psammophila CBS 110553]EXJ61296.1 hypothetical protein A1O5_11853 [Cladophialophora psammophila CBS 110553]